MKEKKSVKLKGLLLGSAAMLAACGFAAGEAAATNGDNLIGIGPIARSMGGVGVAAPQDAISAVFANPAAMCFGPYCPGSELNFAGTVFDPTVKARVISPGMGVNTSGESTSNPFVIPAIGLSMPINPKLRFGLAAYGVSGMGVDYRDQLDFGGAPFFSPTAQEGEIFSQYQVMKFAPNLAYLLNEHLSLGASIHVGYAALDLGQGSSHGFGAGVQLGVLYKTGPVSFGLSYISPQKVTHEKVFDFDGNGIQDDLDLEAPQNIAIGVALQPTDKLLVEVDAKWLNWANAAGYEDFDWENQWVFGIGAQYRPIPSLALRAGFNYGASPVKEHNGFNAASSFNLQGKTLPTFNYEYFRIIGFPAVAEKHLGLGIGYDLTKALSLNFGYKHAFETTVSETGNNFGIGVPITLESDLSENSYELGLTMRF